MSKRLLAVACFLLLLLGVLATSLVPLEGTLAAPAAPTVRYVALRDPAARPPHVMRIRRLRLTRPAPATRSAWRRESTPACISRGGTPAGRVFGQEHHPPGGI